MIVFNIIKRWIFFFFFYIFIKVHGELIILASIPKLPKHHMYLQRCIFEILIHHQQKHDRLFDVGNFSWYEDEFEGFDQCSLITDKKTCNNTNFCRYWGSTKKCIPGKPYVPYYGAKCKIGWKTVPFKDRFIKRFTWKSWKKYSNQNISKYN